MLPQRSRVQRGSQACSALPLTAPLLLWARTHIFGAVRRSGELCAGLKGPCETFYLAEVSLGAYRL